MNKRKNKMKKKNKGRKMKVNEIKREGISIWNIY